MLARLAAVTAAVLLVALLVPVLLLGSSVSPLSIIGIGAAALVGGLALSRSGSRVAARAGAAVAIAGAAVLAAGVGLFALAFSAW